MKTCAYIVCDSEVVLIDLALNNAAKVILDRDTGRSKGFGFVTYSTTEAASSAIQAYDGQVLLHVLFLCTFYLTVDTFTVLL